MTTQASTDRVLGKLDDSEAETWSRGEVELYLEDGKNLLCRRTKCVFDMAYVENLPAVGNYSSDEEFELAKQVPNLILTGKRHFTREVDKQLAPSGSVGPAGVSTHNQITHLTDLNVSKPSPVGQLPRNFVDVQQVVHDQMVLTPEYGFALGRNVDNRYETLSGDPDWYTIDKDGVFSLRRYPHGDGAAEYAEVIGWWGSETSDDDYTLAVIPSSLTRAWKLNETTGVRVEVSGIDDLTPSGVVSFATGRDGNALDLSGAGYLISGNTTLGLTSHFTISFQFRCAAGLTQKTIMAKDLNAGQFIIEVNNNLVVGSFGSGFCTISAPYLPGDWNHAAFAWNGTTLYGSVNGVPVVGNALGSPGLPAPVFTASPLWIGDNEWGGNAFTGGIDEVYIFNEALTTAQLQNKFYPFATPPDTVEVIGSWGTLVSDPEHFPLGGPWGIPTRTHPDVNNTRVEISRLAVSLDELPANCVKYIEYWACSRALKRDGPGQDLKLSQHYAARFDVGVERVAKRVRSVQSEYAGRIGHGPQRKAGSSMDIHLPYNYGRQLRRSGGY